MIDIDVFLELTGIEDCIDIIYEGSEIKGTFIPDRLIEVDTIKKVIEDANWDVVKGLISNPLMSIRPST